MITRAQFDNIRPLLEAHRRTTRPRKHDLYDVFEAILYLLKDPKASWRTLPDKYPP